MRIQGLLVLVAAAALGMGAAGCGDCKCSMREAKSCKLQEGCGNSHAAACGGAKCKAHAADAEKPVNAKCPIMEGQAVKSSVETRKFEGKTVGFCCGGCPKAWDKLTDAEKKQKLEACMK